MACKIVRLPSVREENILSVAWREGYQAMLLVQLFMYSSM